MLNWLREKYAQNMFFSEYQQTLLICSNGWVKNMRKICSLLNINKRS